MPGQCEVYERKIRTHGQDVTTLVMPRRSWTRKRPLCWVRACKYNRDGFCGNLARLQVGHCALTYFDMCTYYR